MARPKTVAADYKRLTLRVPQAVYDEIHKQAASIGRPVNTQALYVLLYGLGLDPTPPLPGGKYGNDCSRNG